jgi:hypothetical protein
MRAILPQCHQSKRFYVAREVSRISSAGQLSSKSKQRTHLILHQPFTASNKLDSTPCIDRTLMPAFGNDLSFGAACEVGPTRAA